MYLAWLVTLLLWYSIAVLRVYGTVTVTVTPPAAPVLTGQTTVIGCSYTASAAGSRTEVQWYRDPAGTNEQIVDHEVGADTYYYGSQVGRLDIVGDTNLRINNTQLSDGGLYRCQVNVRGVGRGSGDVAVSVRALPSEPTLTISPPSPTTLAPVTLTCTTTGALPAATISWYRGDVDKTGEAAAQQDTQQSDGTFTSTRTVTFTPTKADHRVTYRCVVTHGALQGELQASSVLDVRYPAEMGSTPPTTTTVISGQSATLDCTADGNPASFTYTWKERNRDINPNTEDQYSVAGGVLTISDVRREQHNRQYSCEVTNNIGSPDTASTTLNVQFAPEVSSPASSTVNEGDDLTVLCQVSANPAASSVQWTEQDSSTAVSDSATLSITSISQSAAGTYVCTAQNTFHDSSTGTGTSNTVVTVQYAPSKPTVTIAPNPVVENQTVTLTCQSDSALPDPAYMWKFTAQGQSEQDVDFGTTADSGGTMTITNVQRGQAGQYRCTATNDVGTTDSDLAELVVNYPPSVVSFKAHPNPADENNPVNLTCIVDSNPAPTSVSIVRVGTGSVDDVTLATGQGRTFSHTIQTVSYTDTGTYRCQAGNGVGEAASRDLELLVNYIPVFVGLRDKYAVAKGDPVTLTCNVTAYPTPVTFSWTKDGGSVPDTATVTNYSLGSTLSYTAVTETGYGSYNCTAMNIMGSRSTVIQLAAESDPEPSTNLTVTMKNSSRFVTVEWTAGFNGGQDTTHTVQYRTDGGAWNDGPQETEPASDDHPQFSVTLQLPDKATYDVRVRVTNRNGFTESNVESVLIEGAKTLYGSLPLTSETFSNELTDLQSTLAVQLTNRIINELDRVFDDILGYEKSTVSRYSQGSVVAAFQSVVGESESESAQTAFRTSLTDNQLGSWTVDSSKASIGDTPPTDIYGGGATVIIIVAVVCGVVLLALIAVAVVVVRRRKSAGKKPAENRPNSMELDNVRGDVDDGYQSLRMPHRQTSDHTYQGLMARSGNELTSDGAYEDVRAPSEFPRNQLDIKEELGQGEFGSVYKAEAWKISGTSGTTVVAVKELKGMSTAAASTAFFKELAVLKLLGTHPNVVYFLGCCTDTEPFYLLLEYVSGGSLQSTLRTSRTQQTYGNLHGGSKSLSSRDLTRFAWDVAKGMSFLSAKKILHRDLATRNVLVSANRTCKVSDFGFSREGDEYERTSKTRLPVRWMAPESLFHRKYTTKTDVWAFGVLLWEIVTLGATPYPGMSKREVMDGVQQGYRMGKPNHCDQKLYTLMLSCWNADPARRPEFRRIQRTLESLMETEHDYINLSSLDENTYQSLQTATDEKY